MFTETVWTTMQADLEPRVNAADRTDFTEAALRIGLRLAAAAEWNGGRCGWPDAPEPATLYHGSAGIALFLAELAVVTADAVIARTALGGIEHGLRAAEAMPAGFSLYSGPIGVAFAAVRTGELLGRADLFARADAIIRPLLGREASDRALDVIGGAAGAIPALLRMCGPVDSNLVLEIARALGEHLVRAAVRDPGGWSWNTVPRGTAVRNLCGYAHGASGVGHALLELYAATGDSRFRYGAEQAFLYERQFFDAVEGNWHDLRVMDMVVAMHAGTEQLRARLLAGEVPSGWRPTFSLAWCHGAPGIARARMRAYELLGDPAYLEEARAAARATQVALGGEPGFSLCHGTFGNADTLLHASASLGEPEFSRVAAQQAHAAAAYFEGRSVPWPCGAGDRTRTSGLMLGEAGIGLFLLRLACPDIPSPLFITGCEMARDGADPGGYEALRDQQIAGAAERSFRRFQALGVDVDYGSLRRPMHDPPRRSDAEAAIEAVERHIAEEPDAGRRKLLEDASRLDRAAHALAGVPTDDSLAFMRDLIRLPADAVPWDSACLALAPNVQLVSTNRDWDGWVRNGAGDGPDLPLKEQRDYVVVRRSGVVIVEPIARFAALVLKALAGGASLAEASALVAASVDAPADTLRPKLLAQLRAAYERRLVDIVAGAGPTPKSIGPPASEPATV